MPRTPRTNPPEPEEKVVPPITFNDVREFRLRQLRTDFASAFSGMKDYELEPVLRNPSLANLNRLAQSIDSLRLLCNLIEELEKLK